MKHIAHASFLVLLLFAACDAPAQPPPTPPPDIPLRMAAAVTPTPMLPAYYIVVAEGTYLPVTPFPTVPMPTPMPLPSPTRPSAVAIHPINPNRLPSLPQDVAFLNDGVLQVWRHDRGVVEPLVNVAAGELPVLGQPLPEQSAPIISVHAHSIQPNIGKIALRFSYQNRATYVGVYDMQMHAITPLDEASPGMSGPDTLPTRFLQFSPDGRWLAYVTSERLTSGSANGKGRGMNAPALGGWGLSGSVRIVSTDGRSAPIKLGECLVADNVAQPCDGFVWSPDSTQLAWSDARGIWVAGVGAKARLLQAVDGQMFGAPMMHHVVLSWSPDGQWLLARNHIQAGASLALIDVASRQRLTLEQAWMSLWSPQHALWLADDSLVVAAQGDGKINSSPALLWYRISDANSVDAIAPWRVVSLGLPPANIVFGLAAHDDGNIGFGVTNADASDDRSRGIYRISSTSNTARKRNDLPVFMANYGGVVPATLVWSRDGAAAIYMTPESALLVSAVDSPLLDLQLLSNQPYSSVCCFTWLP